MASTILIADDEAEIRDLLRLYLENENYNVLEAADGQEALRLFGVQHIDLCILDVMMPGMDGFHVLRELRSRSNLPVLMLSARDRDEDKILGLNLGADDYLAKPFNPLEAVARVNSAIRRYYALGAEVSQKTAARAGTAGSSGAAIFPQRLAAGDLELDEESCTLRQGDRVIDLTPVEYRIMHMFLKHPGRVFTKQQIFEHGWGETYAVSDNNIMVCISKLRSKLDPDDPARYIRTIRGLGYRLEKP